MGSTPPEPARAGSVPAIVHPRLLCLGPDVLVPAAPTPAMLAFLVVANLVLAGQWLITLPPAGAPALIRLLPVGIPLAILLYPVVRGWAAYVRSREASRRLLEKNQGRSWAERGASAIIRGRRRLRPRAIDVEHWFAPGEDEVSRPWVIAAGCVPRFIEGESVAEPVDVGPGRRVDRRDRKALVRQCVFLAVWFGLVAWMASRVPGPFYWLTMPLIGAIMLIMVLNLLGRFGWNPIALSSAIASPGRLETGSVGATRVFTPADSVLVVMPVRRPRFRLFGTTSGLPDMVFAMARRRDGARAAMAFDHEADPGLSDLLCRWLTVP